MTIWKNVSEQHLEDNKLDLELISQLENQINKLDLKGKDKISIVKTRVNQGIFRDRLLRKYGKCCLCNIENTSLLVASHIKPWSVSNSDEKLDDENGFLFCPDYDALFDEGFISFDDNGQIIISDRLNSTDRLLTNVNQAMKLEISERNKKYLKYHRDYVFK